MSRVLTRPPHLLWLDDELGTEDEYRLLAWKEWFDAKQRATQLRWTPCATLECFAQKLQAHHAAREGDNARLDALIIDIMLTKDPDTHFKRFGFAQERCLPLDCGCQLVGLMRHPRYHGKRPPWLQSGAELPVVLLSSSALANEMVENYVVETQGVFAEVKSLSDNDWKDSPCSKGFIERIEVLIAQVGGTA